MAYEKILITTGDGSHTIYVPGLDEHYHSTHGAIQESKHIFIERGFNEAIKGRKNINILEMGFGTGLNALLTYLETQNQSLAVHYTSIEAFPVEAEMVKNLNYPMILGSEKVQNVFLDLHTSPWGSWTGLPADMPDNARRFKFLKINVPLLSFGAEDRFDLVYFDAFAPEIQPELWTTEVFERMYQWMNPGGIFVTYCCKGTVKRSMKSAGFRIEKLAGPPGKREMLKAHKDM